MRRAPRDSETAISQVAGMTIFLFLAVVVSGSAYAWIRSIEPPMTPSHSVAFTPSSTVAWPEGMAKNLTVHAASRGTYWWNLEVRLDGERIKCAETPGERDSWRLWWQGRVMPCTGPRNVPDELVGAGQTIEIWDEGASASRPLAGRTLQLADADLNAVVVRVLLT